MEYIDSVRREIEQMWEELYYGDVQKGRFHAFWEGELCSMAPNLNGKLR
jgi:hypothetical protein